MARPTLRYHRKMKRLTALVAQVLPRQMKWAAEPLARGLLEQLWEVCYETGDERVGDALDVETAAGWKGEPGRLVEALLNAGGVGQNGFIRAASFDAISTVFVVHDLWDHAPNYVRRRKQREHERQVKGREFAELSNHGLNRAKRPVSDEPVTNQMRANAEPVVSTPAPAPAPAPAPNKKDTPTPQREEHRGAAKPAPDGAEGDQASPSKTTDARSEDFDAFWKAYPKRVGKGAARRAWEKTSKGRPPIAEVIAKLEAQKRTPDWRKDQGRYIPHPATWLNQERWSDEVPGPGGGVVKITPEIERRRQLREVELAAQQLRQLVIWHRNPPADLALIAEATDRAAAHLAAAGRQLPETFEARRDLLGELNAMIDPGVARGSA